MSETEGAVCKCDDENFWCDVHVSCDSKCQALEEPVTDEEVRYALEHWKNHGYLNGCSHGQ